MRLAVGKKRKDSLQGRFRARRIVPEQGIFSRGRFFLRRGRMSSLFVRKSFAEFLWETTKARIFGRSGAHPRAPGLRRGCMLSPLPPAGGKIPVSQTMTEHSSFHPVPALSRLFPSSASFPKGRRNPNIPVRFPPLHVQSRSSRSEKADAFPCPHAFPPCRLPEKEERMFSPADGGISVGKHASRTHCSARRKSCISGCRAARRMRAMRSGVRG